MQKTEGNSENTPVLYDWCFDSFEIGGNWFLKNNYSHGWFEKPFSRSRY